MENIDRSVIEFLCHYFQDDTLKLKVNDPLPEMDSICFIELIVNTEIEYDIELYDEELLYDSSITAQNWVDIVKKHLSDAENDNITPNNYLLMD